ncbi:MAG: hypothetical protein P8Z81_00855 [Deinococcales bacterium]
MRNAFDNAHPRVVLNGSVRLEVDGQPLEIRRKGLAVLAYLAVMGHGSRDRVAHMLWSGETARGNLRVELYRLTHALGRPICERGDDPLRLPAWLTLETRPQDGAWLDGLDGITAAFDDWLSDVRSQSHDETMRNLGAEALGRNVARHLPTPFLVVVRTAPGDNCRDFAGAVGDALRLPVVGRCNSEGQVLRLVTPPYPDGCVNAILANREGGHVLEAPAYGEDPREILELRNALDPSTVRYVRLPPTTWEDARSGMLRDLPFERAARAYLLTGGNAGFLRELVRTNHQGDMSGDAPVVPQRIRAAYQLELRYASLEARMALERLSVHPGTISEGLIDALGARGVVDELERRGWVIYDGAWRFREPESRNVIYHSLQPGRRVAYHREAAAQMEVEGNWLGWAYHKQVLGQELDWRSSLAPKGIDRLGVQAWKTGSVDASGAVPRPVIPGASLALLEQRRIGPGLVGDGVHWRFVRQPGQAVSSVWFEVPDRARLLHISGRTYVGSPLGVGIEGDGYPLVLELPRGGRAVFLGGLRTAARVDDTLLLPLPEELDEWLLLPQASALQLACRADEAVLEIDVEIFDCRAADAGSSGRAARGAVPGAAVTAWEIAGE